MDARQRTTAQQADGRQQAMNVSAASLIRWTGLAAMAAGIIFAGI